MSNSKISRKRFQEDTQDAAASEIRTISITKNKNINNDTDGELSFTVQLHNPKKTMYDTPISRLSAMRGLPRICAPPPNMLPLFSHSTPYAPQKTHQQHIPIMNGLVENSFRNDSTIYLNNHSTNFPHTTMMVSMNNASRCSDITRYANLRTPFDSISQYSMLDTSTVYPEGFNVQRLLTMPPCRFQPPARTKTDVLDVLDVDLESVMKSNSIINIKNLENWFTHHTGRINLTYGNEAKLIEFNVEFFTYVCKKLSTYMEETGKEMLDHTDVGEVMKRTLKISPQISFNSLIHQYLPMELWFNYYRP